MVVYITPAEGNGGILQFSTTITRETKKFCDFQLFVPDTVDDKFLVEVSECVQKYTKVKTINGNNKQIFELCRRVMANKPEKVVFLEDSVLMQQMNTILRKHNIITAIVIHDVVYHPANKLTLRRKIVERLRQYSLKKTINTANYLILLSNNSVRYFQERHTNYKAKTIMFRLGAHLPHVSEVAPEELSALESKYILFFGRVDKYKGIGRLCREYTAMDETLQEKVKLVVAGRGVFTEEESKYIADNKNIIAINRFITDEEMSWLMDHAEIVTVPYIEASQSGVIPIAYHFGKAVIASDLPGLVENIRIGETGFIFDSDAQLKQLLEEVANGNLRVDEDAVHSFYSETYNWEKNIKKLLDEIV